MDDKEFYGFLLYSLVCWSFLCFAYQLGRWHGVREGFKRGVEVTTIEFLKGEYLDKLRKQ